MRAASGHGTNEETRRQQQGKKRGLSNDSLTLSLISPTKKNKVKYAKMRRAASNPQLTQFVAANNNHEKEPITSTYSTHHPKPQSNKQTNAPKKACQSRTCFLSVFLSFFFLFFLLRINNWDGKPTSQLDPIHSLTRPLT
jgi:hypothetical protein